MFKVCTERCIGCGVCVDFCSEGAIILTDVEVAEIDPQKCASCGVCADICPQEAIDEIK